MCLFLFFAVLVLSASSFLALRSVLKVRTRAPLPPGPQGLPLVGNVLDIPSSYPHKVFAEWKYKYGTIFGKPYIIINDLDIATELLERRSALYSDRPTMCMAGELVGWDHSLALQRFGKPRFREFRKHFFHMFGTHTSVARFRPLLQNQSAVLLKNILTMPAAFSESVRNSIGAIMLKSAYGYDVQGEHDPIVEVVERAMRDFAEVFGKTDGYLVDYIPWLKYLPERCPGVSFKRKARAFARTFQAMGQLPFDFVTKQIAALTQEQGTAEPCFLSNVLAGDKPAELHNAKWAAASIYAGGADTTVSLMQTFFLVMTLFPSAQRKAQAEIDLVIGSERLPCFDDRNDLPYVDALLKECLRWGPVAPIALPHRLMRDDVYDGYLLPEGSVIWANIWAMLHDSDKYDSPEEFIPDRFLSSCGKEPEQDPGVAVFGFGRRICPGLHLAIEIAWIQIALVLAVFDISKAIDECGEEITPTTEYTQGGIVHPVPFRCMIKPRSAQAGALVLAAQP
ncbi:cytochrome P450 [Vararia minispora EC-137]|uniref:Cytochrome P450 n=1 Tax=Vararia minispora EC-137 TaxID=1314806 RepID=A0ACB8QPG7_9AGAM|nr:cytochrome P450 [Vararia minispora EC-137]